MGCEFFEKIHDYKYGDLLVETHHWLIIMAPVQKNLGTCVVALKRDEIELSGLTNEEWFDFSYVVKKLEKSIKKAFNSTMFNWGCLMNSSYLETPPSPHLHWHFIPRYRNPIEFHGKTFEDLCFGSSTMYDRRGPVELSDDFRKKIKTRIMEYLEI